MVWLFHRVITLGFVLDGNGSSDGMTPHLITELMGFMQRGLHIGV